MTAFCDLAAIQMPFDAHPVIQRLQRQVNVLIHLEFDHRQPPVTIDGQQVDDSAVAPRELRHLTVDRLVQQRCVQRFDIGTDARFEPSFGLSRPRRARRSFRPRPAACRGWCNPVGRLVVRNRLPS